MAVIIDLTGNNNITGTASGDTIVTGSGNDTINALGGNNNVSSGAGNDTIITGSGKDVINAGSGNDIIDAGGGSDIVEGGLGDDIFIHRIAENVGSKDLYDGSLGADTLRFVLTAAEWARADVQADIAAFLNHLKSCANRVLNPLGLSTPFTFRSTNLTVLNIGALQVFVDGIQLDPNNDLVTAVADTLQTTEDNAASIDLLANDIVPDRAASVTLLTPSTLGTVSLVTSLGTTTQTAQLNFTPSAALQSLRAGEVRTETLQYKVVDVNGDSAISTVTVRVVGVNDAATIVTDANVTQDVSVTEAGGTGNGTPGDATASGKLLVSDVDTGEAKFQTPVSLTGTYGNFTFNADTGAWTYVLDQVKAQALAQGELVQDKLTVKSFDGTATQDIVINVNGANDAPVITTPTVNASITEDTPNGSSISGVMTATDPDHGAKQFWTAVGASAPQQANYQFRMDEFKIIKNGGVIFDDKFDNGVPPPQAPNFANGDATSYNTAGGMTEVGGKLILDSSSAAPVLGIGTPDPFVGNFALLRSNIDPNSDLALKSNANFIVQGTFDLIIPDSPREVYGIRLTDRLTGGPGNPPDQLGDDLVELVVRMGQDGIVRVYLRELDAVADVTNNVGAVALTPPAGATQIVLSLAHSTTDVGFLTPTFQYLDASGQTIGPAITVPQPTNQARIFGTETPGFTGDDENWTRAQIVAYAPALTDTTKTGTYGKLTVGQNGSWTYALANNQTNVQNLGEGETRVDTFTVQVTDEFGATDTETINITVNGRNDGPIVQQPAVSRFLTEDAASTLTATGLNVFSDIDLPDTHTVTATFAGGSYTSGRAIEPALLAAAGSALTANLFDDSTNNTVGQFQWHFTLDNSLVQSLGAFESLQLVYSVVVRDNHNAAATQQVTINIRGTNDAPVVTAEVGDSAGQEFQEGNSGIVAQGTLTVTDVDVTDQVSVFVAGLSHVGPTGGISDGVLQSFFSVTPGIIVDGTHTTGKLTWSFNSGSQAFDFLSEGQELTLYYTIRPNDGPFPTGTGDGVVTIRITGTNDGPVITTPQRNFTFTEVPNKTGDFFGTSINDSAYISFDDPDLVDTHTVSHKLVSVTYSGGTPVPQAALDGFGSFVSQLPSNSDSTGTGHGNASVSFGFPDAVLDFLAEGETIKATYAIKVTDNHGAESAPQLSTITVTGSNDTPEVFGPVSGGGSEGSGTQTVDLLAGATDADNGAVLHIENVVWVEVPGSLPAGFSIAGNSLSIDTNALAYNQLAQGQTFTTHFTYDVVDEHGAHVAQTATVTLVGTNDAPTVSAAIQASAPEGSGTASIDLLQFASDIDNGAVLHVENLAWSSSSTLPAGFQLSGNTLLVDASAPAYNSLNVGQSFTAQLTFDVVDEYGARTSQTAEVTITGTNDAPVITTPPVTASVTEDVSTTVSGQMSAFDPDNGAKLVWSATGGSAPQQANYQFVMDEFKIIKNGSQLFDDKFDNGGPPPQAPNFTNANNDPASYNVTGGMVEANGRLILDSSTAVPILGIGTPDPFIGHSAILRTNIDPASPTLGLRSNSNFVVQGTFDLVIPDDPREVYGIRLTDRLVGASGPNVPPDQLGDDLVELVVRKGQDGIVRVQLRELDAVADTTTNVGSVNLTPPANATQILLSLSHSTSNVGFLTPTFQYLDANGQLIGSPTTVPQLSNAGRIFGTETSTTSDDENWTRAQIIAYAPAITDTTKAGTYGSLTIGQNGSWTYALANNQTNVQNLGEGETRTDTFTVQVQDEHGALDTETITVTVNGRNDGPIFSAPAVADFVSEDAGSTIMATGLNFFSDIDLPDTHTIATAFTGATLSSGRPVDPALLTLANSALSATIFDDSTNDTAGQIKWDFALNSNAVQSLAAGETLSLVYDVTVKDNHNATATEKVTINITGSNDAPVFNDNNLGYTFGPVAENQGAGIVVGQVQATDVDYGSAQFYEFANGLQTSGLFNIDRNTGVITTNGSLDYETAQNHALSVVVRDQASGGLTDTATVNVAVGDVVESAITLDFEGLALQYGTKGEIDNYQGFYFGSPNLGVNDSGDGLGVWSENYYSFFDGVAQLAAITSGSQQGFCNSGIFGTRTFIASNDGHEFNFQGGWFATMLSSGGSANVRFTGYKDGTVTGSVDASFGTPSHLAINLIDVDRVDITYLSGNGAIVFDDLTIG